MLAGANADLRGQLSGAQAALRAKEAEYNCRISGSDRPLRFEHWGARGDYAFYFSVS